ncbi:hypothetical protein BD779DRAFT_649777 [Infundibulicybe gibba]|nr:hypothetical protein BD779DRAFT_649777 [Infundibulicybe gibba]
MGDYPESRTTKGMLVSPTHSLATEIAKTRTGAYNFFSQPYGSEFLQGLLDAPALRSMAPYSHQNS